MVDTKKASSLLRTAGRFFGVTVDRTRIKYVNSSLEQEGKKVRRLNTESADDITMTGLIEKSSGVARNFFY